MVSPTRSRIQRGKTFRARFLNTRSNLYRWRWNYSFVMQTNLAKTTTLVHRPSGTIMNCGQSIQEMMRTCYRLKHGPGGGSLAATGFIILCHSQRCKSSPSGTPCSSFIKTRAVGHHGRIRITGSVWSRPVSGFHHHL